VLGFDRRPLISWSASTPAAPGQHHDGTTHPNRRPTLPTYRPTPPQVCSAQVLYPNPRRPHTFAGWRAAADQPRTKKAASARFECWTFCVAFLGRCIRMLDLGRPHPPRRVIRGAYPLPTLPCG
jgi:hypothetical protein